MKTIKIITILTLMLVAQFTFGQLKVINSGFVGVGTNTPWQRLHVKGGNLMVENNNALIRIFARNPNIGGLATTIGSNKLHISFWDHTVGQNAGFNILHGTFSNASDRKFKEEITKIESPLEILSKLEGKHYKMKSNKNVEVQQDVEPIYDFGFIAQEVEKIIPEIVSTVGEGEGSFKSMKYTSIIPILVEGFKVQQKTIEEQQEKIEELSNQVSTCCAASLRATSINSLGESNLNEATVLGKLYQNQPNPFKESTIIKYEINQEDATASIMVFDMQGALIKTIGLSNNNLGSITINGNELQPGMYMYSLIVNNKEVDTKRMIITE